MAGVTAPPPLPLSEKTVIRVLLVLTVILALAAGFFQTSLSAEQKKYLRLEDRYVRVRNSLGVEETQRLIDESY